MEKKKKQEQKEAAKAEKQRKATEQAHTKAMQKEHAQTMSIAVKAIGKLQPIFMEMQGRLFDMAGHERVENTDLPPALKMDAMAAFKKISMMYNLCQQRMVNPDVVLLFGLADVRDTADTTASMLQQLKAFPMLE